MDSIYVNKYVAAKVELEVLKYQLSLLKKELRKAELKGAERSVSYRKERDVSGDRAEVYADVSGAIIRMIFGWEITPEAQKIVDAFNNKED
mgnify:FL=1